MSTFNKSHWVSDGDNISLSMPFAKVDKENRIVSGFATLDNADKQGDIVLADSSRRAFDRFRGNIREMHQPIAVGRMIDFKEDSYYDSDTEKWYDGIYASVYVSKGAQDTWEKVLDGTLTGFSIGGRIKESEKSLLKNNSGELQPVRIIKEYDLAELSLVDSPANPLANVFSITKSDEGMMIKGMITEISVENVFWCARDEVAKTSTNDSEDCLVCDQSMKNVGWFEYDNTVDKSDKAKGVIDSHLELIAKSEGGADMPKENTDEVVIEDVEKSDDVVAEEAEVAEGDETEEVEKAEAVEEVEIEEPDVEKVLSEFKKSIDDALEAQNDRNREVIEKFEALAAEFSKKTEEFVSRTAELTEKFEALNNQVDSVEKRLGSLSDEPGLKKSVDIGGEVKKNETSAWGGIFTGSTDL